MMMSRGADPSQVRSRLRGSRWRAHGGRTDIRPLRFESGYSGSRPGARISGQEFNGEADVGVQAVTAEAASPRGRATSRRDVVRLR
ncbi:hypothetical protein DN539_34755, partial [Burkholderia multivorans]